MMTKFSKNLIVMIFLILASLAVANFVFAQVDVGLEYGEQIGLASTDPRIIIARVIQVALGFLGIIAVVLIMYAGWMWMTSEGNEEKITKAKNILKNAIIGLIIILSAFGIASFILNRLMGATGGGPGGGGAGPGGGGGGGIGVLGSCTVESVYPEPDQKEVPRNTSIIVTFKEEVKPETICASTSGDPVRCDAGSKIKQESDPLDNHVKLFKTNDSANIITDISVATKDNKTFVFTPSAFLGSPSESIWYTIYLSNAIEKVGGGQIFDTCSQDYLEWQFQVSEKLDLTPPQVNEKGVFPLPASVNPRNSIVQINFNEAINPITISGNAQDVKDYIRIVNVASSPVASGGTCAKDADCVSFKCNSGKCEGTNDYLEGKFIVSNQYRTVEFISNNQCGVNGCGEKIYCLPGESQIRVELGAANLADCGPDNCVSRSPYNNCSGGHCRDVTEKIYPLSLLPLAGVADMAFNSLDGNRDGDADGPVNFYNENSPVANTGDNYQWSFSISDEIDLSPPKITATSQENASGAEQPLNQGATGAHLANPILIDFDKVMMSSSLGTGSIIINNGKENVEHKLINLISATLVPPDPTKPAPVLPGYWIAKKDIPEDNPSQTQVEIRHSMFGDSTNYRTQVGSGVKDTYQNCFKPSSGLSCTGNPSCCNGTPTDSSTCP